MNRLKEIIFQTEWLRSKIAGKLTRAEGEHLKTIIGQLQMELEERKKRP